MKVQVYNTKGDSLDREIELNPDIFGVEPNEHVLYLAVKRYLAAQRTGTHATKEKSQLSGSTRKLKRQKGTGTARAGSIKNPLFRGGARIFGPRPRSYDIKLNKKVRRLARISALSAKAKDGAIKIVDQISFDAPRTKEAAGVLERLQAPTRGRVLIVTDQLAENTYKSFRNLPNAQVVTAQSLNVYDLLNASTVIMTEGSVEAIQNTLQK